MKEIVFKPRIDVIDTGEAFEVTLELPGVEVRDVHTRLRHGVLTIEGEKARRGRRPQEGNLTVTERNFGRFRREIALDLPPEQHSLNIQFEKGVMKITIAKNLRPSPETALFEKAKRKPKAFLRNLFRRRKTSRKSYHFYED
jgi:HSP20 family molecular chaperone IbpA